MKKAIAILFLSLLFLQVIPVGHFFSSAERFLYAAVDNEDKPDEGKVKEKKESKEYLTDVRIMPELLAQQYQYRKPLSSFLPAPHLECFTPPPDVTC